MKTELKNNLLDILVSEINELNDKENLQYLADKKARFLNSLNTLFDLYDNEILDLKSRLKSETISSRQYRSTLSSNETIINEEINDKHLNLSVVTAILDNLTEFLIEHPSNNKIRKLIEQVEIVKTYIIINLFTEVTRRKELEYFNKSLTASIDNLRSVFNWLEIDIDYLTNWTNKFYYGEKTLYEKYPDMQLNHLKNINDKGIISGSFNELFRRSERLVFAEIELRHNDQMRSYQNDVDRMRNLKYPEEDIKLLSKNILLTTLEKKFRELSLNQQQATDFLR
jgi:hypothetical protein